MIQAIILWLLKPVGMKFGALFLALLAGLASAYGVMEGWRRNWPTIKEFLLKYGWWALFFILGVYFAAIIFPYIEGDEEFIEKAFSLPGFIKEKYEAACTAHVFPAAICPAREGTSQKRPNKVYEV